MVIFSSSPYFKQIYETLTKAGFKVDILVTECPKPAGRKLKICPNPAYLFAKTIGLPILAPEKLDLEYFSKYKIPNTKYFSDIGLIHAYGQIIPQSFIDKFEHGILNIHPSLLPKYRGASPIISAILNGDKKTGYSIILTDATCDTGKIVAQKKVNILANDTHDTLRQKIMTLAIADLPKIIKDFLGGKITPYPQNEKFATLTSKIKKSDGLITKNNSTQTAFNKIRAFSDWPKAYFEIDGKRIIVHSAKIENSKLLIDVIQLAGKNKVKFAEFKNGYADLLTKMPNFVKV